MSMGGFINTPSMGDIHRLENRVAALELVVVELLTVLRADGTLENTEYDDLCERLGI